MANFEEEIKRIVKEIRSPNIAVIGRIGVGKSTLINAVFGAEVAKVGAGLPVSKGFVRYPRDPDEKSPVVLYDSAGYESNKETEFVESTLRFLEELRRKGIEEQIHLVWYVVNASSARFEYFDRDIINKLYEQQVPVIIVLSQCDRAKPNEIYEIKRTIDNFKFKNTYDLIEASASPLEINGKPICDPFGLKELIGRTVDLLPEVYSEAVLVMQKADVEAKRKVAGRYVFTAAIACFSASFIPIPFTTPVSAMTAQSALCVKLAALYGYTDMAAFLGSISGLTTSALFTFLSTATLDLIGSIFPPSQVIAGSTAATYTTVLGLSYTSVFEKVAKEHIYKSGKYTVRDFLRKTFREEFEKYSRVKIYSIADLEKLKELFLKGQL
ncbi:50S ribosome-binding GTPase [Planktothrix sp. FACHB-1355]|uniref:50S ribosome-binding GTPase n=1 Tax=Aerosakkonema funiforme FACHB-1375 TaxID=2949571 RepID=A0A926VGT3_9CYAN|nr:MULTISPECIES: GTPase [Oscillatoriales]MBD2183420.1 50S ribosome-binding GTPase [Aerosakkonema funiforme FACHB-1375]MBD3559232.1 50S ribosome-binding GTPase [Planktothrix sp. FACHB-1355]